MTCENSMAAALLVLPFNLLVGAGIDPPGGIDPPDGGVYDPLVPLG